MIYHKCVNCGKIYEHASEEIINGCPCGSKLFYFKKNNGKKKVDEDVDYFYELEDNSGTALSIFDIESINIVGSGKYELNLNGLMGNDGLIYKYGDGKYSIDLDNNFKRCKKKKR